MAVALAAIAAGWFWLSRPDMPMAVAPPPAAAPAEGQADPGADSAAPATAERPVLPEPTADEAVKAETVTDALTQLLGRDAVLKFLETTDFPRRFVATLDNLGREHAPVASWPVSPTPGRFIVANNVIAPENTIRYGPFVAFVGSVNAAQAVDLYRRMYPVLQQAYRDLGFPDRSLHDRMFEVIDLLLATPEPAQPPKIVLTEVKGPVAPERPWTRYEYADPKLQGLAAGQKILLRVGPENRQVLKDKLREIRAELVRASSTAPPSAASSGPSRP